MGRRMRKRNVWKGRLRYEDGVEMGKKGAMPEPGRWSAVGRLVMMMVDNGSCSPRSLYCEYFSMDGQGCCLCGIET